MLVQRAVEPAIDWPIIVPVEKEDDRRPDHFTMRPGTDEERSGARPNQPFYTIIIWIVGRELVCLQRKRARDGLDDCIHQESRSRVRFEREPRTSDSRSRPF